MKVDDREARSNTSTIGEALSGEPLAGPVLIELGRGRAGRVVALGGSRHWIGRGPLNELALDDARVSRRHASIVATAGGLAIADGGSTNGTWVDGRRLEPLAMEPLAARATIAFGPNARFFFSRAATRAQLIDAAGGGRVPVRARAEAETAIATRSELAAMLRALRSFGGPARRYVAACENAIVEELESLHDAVKFVRENARVVVALEARAGEGRGTQIWRRAS